MARESLTPINEKPICTQFTCPNCAGHSLKAIVEFDAEINSVDDECAYFTVNEAMEPDVAQFYSPYCDWYCDRQSLVVDYMK